jgi:hypothetical protein
LTLHKHEKEIVSRSNLLLSNTILLFLDILEENFDY